jgi:hypothetical protein
MKPIIQWKVTPLQSEADAKRAGLSLVRTWRKLRLRHRVEFPCVTGGEMAILVTRWLVSAARPIHIRKRTGSAYILHFVTIPVAF